MTRKRKITYQPVIRDRRGHRVPRMKIGASVLREIRAAVEREARRYNVPYSFVVAVALADALSVRLEWNHRYKAPRAALRVIRGGKKAG